MQNKHTFLVEIQVFRHFRARRKNMLRLDSIQ